MWSDSIENPEQLDELLSRPGPAAIDALGRAAGDVMVLGAGGKMGPTLARMLRRAADAVGAPRTVIAVSRFRDPEIGRRLLECGVETLAGDLADRAFVDGLPEAPNIFFLSGMKFGSAGNEPLTWGMNAYVPALVCERFPRSRIVAFSTGNVYGLVPIASGGSKESDPPAPIGEYAMSCLARERIVQYFSERNGTPATIVRLNYAVELRYGVLIDLAQRIVHGQPVDLSMGAVNVIWQGDACSTIVAALADCAAPATVLNVAGAEVLSVRRLAERLAALLGRPVTFCGIEGTDALLNDAAASHRRYGRPRVSIDRLLEWTADWIQRGMPMLGKPTHFEVRSGQF